VSAIAITTPSPKSTQQSQTEILARKWLSAFASLYNTTLRERGERFVEIWVAAVSDLRPEILQLACERAARNCKFFPLPAEIRAQIDPNDDRLITSQRWLANQPSDEELHRRGLEYCARAKEFTLTIIDMSKTYVKPDDFEVHVTKDRLDELERQKEVLRSRGLWK